MRVSRFVVASVFAVVLSVGLSGVAGAQTGQTGNYIFIDSSSAMGAVCHYKVVNSTKGRIYNITVKAPQVWWPDRSADSNTEHGRVGWRAIIEHTNGGATFSKLKQSGIQYATAYEGYPGAYDLADKASFTNMNVGITASNLPSNDRLRVKVKVNWYKKDGSVLGSVSHTVTYNSQRLDGSPSVNTNTPCPKFMLFQ